MMMNDPLLDTKIEDVASGLIPYYSNLLHEVSLSNKENALTIISYIHAIGAETNLSDNYRMDLIRLLSRFSTYFNNRLSFKEITRDNLLAFLDSFRKPESIDSLHKWIGTYNIHRMHLTRFFKWLYSPDIEPNKRPKPSVIDNITQLKRKETSIYKPSDLWTEEDDALFLKYCPSKRIKCYHAVSRDTSCRPHEILKPAFKSRTIRSVYWNMELFFNSKPRPDFIEPSFVRMEDIMTVNPTTIEKDADLAEAAKIMIKQGISGLPVVELRDKIEQTIGIISKSDIVKALTKAQEEGRLYRLF
jgi:CBS domain-containing protein